MSTQSSNAVLQNITTVFGSKASDALRPFQAEAGESMHITGYANDLHSAGSQGCVKPQAGLLEFAQLPGLCGSGLSPLPRG